MMSDAAGEGDCAALVAAAANVAQSHSICFILLGLDSWIVAAHSIPHPWPEREQMLIAARGRYEEVGE